MNERQSESESPTPSLRHALIIDQSSTETVELASALRSVGFEVECTFGSKDALKASGSKDFDLFILNLTTSKCNDEVPKLIRRYHNRSLILLLTDEGDLEQRVNALQQGADDFLIRPFTINQFQERVQTLIKKSSAFAKQSIQIADLIVDPLRNTATRSNRLINLTERELSLLLYLAKQTGNIVSRDEILERVYESDPKSASNVVEVYIGYLRKKIEFEGMPKLLHTFRGRGYMLGDV